MAPKRGTKLGKLVNNEELYKNLALSDVVCPICRCILILPVTLPCNHSFCSVCFEGTVANMNLTCSLCRVRFGSWLRAAKKDDRVVNNKLWQELQIQFSEKIRNRQKGIDDSIEEDLPAAPIKVATAGEIRKEYEEQKRRDDIERQKEAEAEEIASRELIKKLCEEDATNQALLKKVANEKLLKKTAQDPGGVPKPNNTPKKRPLDKLIQNMQLNVVPNTNDKHTNIHSSTCTDLPHMQSKATKTFFSTVDTPGVDSSKSIDKCRNVRQKTTATFGDVEITDSNDSIENECKYFKPIDHRNIPPSASVSAIKVPALVSKMSSLKFETPNPSKIQLQAGADSAFVKYAQHTRKRKMNEHARVKMIKKLNLVDPEQMHSTRKELALQTANERKLPHTMTLRDRKPSNTSPTPSLTLAQNIINAQFQVTLQTEELSTDEVERMRLRRVEQEKADLELAKKLQEEFNRERYSTRSISCRNNIKKPRQLTITEIMSTSKCK